MAVFKNVRDSKSQSLKMPGSRNLVFFLNVQSQTVNFKNARDSKRQFSNLLWSTFRILTI